MQPLDDTVDHVRGPSAGRLIVEYGDYECPYSRRAFREIQRVERRLGDGVRFAFRHFPLTEIHPHALTAAAVAEAAALQAKFWSMHELLFRNQTALEDSDLQPLCEPAGARRCAVRRGPGRRCGIGADSPRCGERGCVGGGTGHAHSVHRRCCAPGPYDAAVLLEALAR